MIKVNRSPLPNMPEIYAWRERAVRAVHELRARIEDDQGPLEFRVPLWNALKPLLTEVFCGKCAYCETSLVGSYTTVDLFRPKARVMEDKSFRGYWWLAYEWNNMYASCQRCNGMKASRFPIEGARAVFDRPESLEEEKPLLLDPCRDDPDEHLAFGEAGIIAPKSRRGEVSIQVFGLNRDDLREARQEAMEAVRHRVTLAVLQNHLNEEMDSIAGSREPYAAARRAALSWLVLDLRAKVEASTGGRKIVRAVERTRPLSSSQVQELAKRAEESLAEKGRYSVEAADPAAGEAARAGQRRIERIEIRNFKCIDSLSLQFPPPQIDHEAWLMLLGENATGKSSVLQAIALALMGQEHADSSALALDAPSFLRQRG